MKNMRLYLPALVMLMAMAACAPKQQENTETEEVDSVETTEETKAQTIASPREQVTDSIGGVAIIVDYGSPAVKDRKIWGGLEQYGVVWRAGANETTSVEFSDEVMIGENKVSAGKYGLYIIPNENEDWVVILNTDWDREEHGAWGAYNYNKENDVARVSVAPEMVDENQERLMYDVTDEGIAFAWEKVRLAIPVEAAITK